MLLHLEVQIQCTVEHIQLYIHVHVAPMPYILIVILLFFAGVILAYNVIATKGMIQMAIEREVMIISHNVIYKLLEQLKVQLDTHNHYKRELLPFITCTIFMHPKCYVLQPITESLKAIHYYFIHTHL